MPTWRVPKSFGALLSVVACAALLVACSDNGSTDATATTPPPTSAPAESPYDGYVSDIYADDANWMCKPGLVDDVCSRDLDATAVRADGSTEVLPHAAADDPPVDCFYAYPTTSADRSPNSNLVPQEDQEIWAALDQAARFNAACRVFAPVYRQATLSMLGGADSPSGVDPWANAYVDVVDAFKHYVANESEGRGFVLMGHSQGAGLLSRLVADEIDDVPTLRDRLVSALILGAAVAVPDGKVVGGDFDNVALCESADQTGCVVSYSSFRADAPPPDNSFFARPRGDNPKGMVAACVNPASLGGGAGNLEPFFAIDNRGVLGAAAQPFADPARTVEIKTPWVTYPDFVDAECVRDGEFSYLALSVNGDPSDPRVDDIGGDISPEWGMHRVDVDVAIGNLVALVQTQARAYSA